MAEEDIIYGKNRHFFGGIEPSNMLAFSGEYSGNVVSITATLPKDTVINGQTLCTVAGAVIRRKITNYPTDEFDGDLVATIPISTVLSDANVEPNGTYYYSAFPFTMQGVYNRNTANRFVVNEPKPMVKFAARSVYNSEIDQVKIELTATLPDGVVGAVIRKSTTSYPLDENDGEEFQTISMSGAYFDENVDVGVTYYYSAFPYTATGFYNRSESNRATVTARRRNYLFGYDLTIATANPAERVTYPSDVDNYGFTPVKMIFGESFNYSGWNFAPGDKFMPRPCMLKYDGTVDYYLDPNNYTKKVSGEASDISNTAYNGNAMIEWPKIFTKRWEEDGVYHFRCSDTQVDAEYECWCNYDRLNNQIDHFYTPIYFGSHVGDRLRSISGVTSMVDESAKTEIDYAKTNGPDWYTEVISDRFLINDLLVMMARNTDLQSIYGFGVVNANSDVRGTGSMNDKGMFWGTNNKAKGVKVFGMEHYWGNILRRTAGWLLINRSQKLKITRGTYDGSTAEDYNTIGAGYLHIPDSVISGSSGGYIKSMKTKNYGRIPVDVTGSSGMYEADGMNYVNSGIMYAAVGGSWIDDLLCGPFASRLDFAPSGAYSYIGASLSCKPAATG